MRSLASFGMTRKDVRDDGVGGDAGMTVERAGEIALEYFVILVV